MIEKLNVDTYDFDTIVDKVNEIIDITNNSLKPKLAIVKFNDSIPKNHIRIVMDHLKDVFQDCGYRTIAIGHGVDISTDTDVLIIDGKPYSNEELRTIIKDYEERK